MSRSRTLAIAASFTRSPASIVRRRRPRFIARIFMVKPKLLAPGTVNPRHQLLKTVLEAVEILATEVPWSALPGSPGLSRQTSADLLAKFLTCSRKSAHIRLDPKVTSTHVENNPFPGRRMARADKPLLEARLFATVQSVWRWCGGGVKIHWLRHRAGPESGIARDHGNHWRGRLDGLFTVGVSRGTARLYSTS
jgi:hypothetical protein